MGPLVEEIAEERADIKVCKLDVDQEPELARLRTDWHGAVLHLPEAESVMSMRRTKCSFSLLAKKRLITQFLLVFFVSDV